jgi:hypothetical protein
VPVNLLQKQVGGDSVGLWNTRQTGLVVVYRGRRGSERVWAGDALGAGFVNVRARKGAGGS